MLNDYKSTAQNRAAPIFIQAQVPPTGLLYEV